MTTRWPCAVVVLSLMACGKPLLLEGGCAGVVCGKTQRCEPSNLRCVKNELPRVMLVAPTTVVSDASFELSGTVGDDTKGTTLSWRDGVDEWHAVEVDDDGAFTITVPSRVLDAEPMLLTVRADDGLQQLERPIIVIVDRVGPRVELQAPALNQIIGGSSVMFTVVARDGSKGLQDLFIGERGIQTPRTDTAVSVPIVIPAGDRQSLPVVVSTKDLNGNRSLQIFTLQVDRTGPALRFISPTASISTPTVRVQVEATDLSAVEQVRLSMDDGGFVDASEQESGVWSAEFPMPLAEREVVFKAAATDAAGQTNVLTLRARVDRIAPTLELASPSDGSSHRQGLTVMASTSLDAVSVTARFDGSMVPLTQSTAGSWEGQLPLTRTGDHVEQTLVLVARDAAGNQRTRSSALFIDTVAPRVTFTSPGVNSRLNAANFAGTDDVLIAWQVQDGDSMAATVSVDGVPTTQSTARVTTSPSDEGRSITRTIVVADRTGNVGTGSLTFTVDRRAPRIVSWSPVANARNVEPRRTTVTFSEQVMGRTTASDALTISGITQPGRWDAAHTTWTSPELSPYTVFDATLNDLTDDAGNPVVVTARKFHTAAFVPGSGLVLGTNVSHFQATADSDGVVTIGTVTAAGYRVFGLSPFTGLAQAPMLSDPHVGTFTLNSSLWVDPNTLRATHRVGSTRYGGMGPGPVVPVGLFRHVIVEGVATAVGNTASPMGGVVSQLALDGETDSTPYGLLDSSTYRRGSSTHALGSSLDSLVTQSASTWAGFGVTSNAVSGARFLCIPPAYPGAQTVCRNFDFQLSPVTNPTELSAAISPSGRCLVVTASSNGARFGTSIPLARCSELRPSGAAPHASCQHSTYPLVAMPGTFVAPFGGHGEDTVLAASEVAGVPQLHKLNHPAACTGFGVAVGAPGPETARAWQPVQLGNKPALLYTDVHNTLKLYVP